MMLAAAATTAAPQHAAHQRRRRCARATAASVALSRCDSGSAGSGEAKPCLDTVGGRGAGGHPMPAAVSPVGAGCSSALREEHVPVSDCADSVPEMRREQWRLRRQPLDGRSGRGARASDRDARREPAEVHGPSRVSGAMTASPERAPAQGGTLRGVTGWIACSRPHALVTMVSVAPGSWAGIMQAVGAGGGSAPRQKAKTPRSSSLRLAYARFAIASATPAMSSPFAAAMRAVFACMLGCDKNMHALVSWAAG